MNTYEILVKARAKIAKPENWTQGVYARDKDGDEVAACANGAVCWCSMGAIDVAYGKYAPIDTKDVFEVLGKHCQDMIGTFNDTHTHEEVLAAFDKAIEDARNDI